MVGITQIDNIVYGFVNGCIIRTYFQEQKPDAGPGDANSEYIKLKVVGNVSKLVI